MSNPENVWDGMPDLPPDEDPGESRLRIVPDPCDGAPPCGACPLCEDAARTDRPEPADVDPDAATVDTCTADNRCDTPPCRFCHPDAFSAAMAGRTAAAPATFDDQRRAAFDAGRARITTGYLDQPGDNDTVTDRLAHEQPDDAPTAADILAKHLVTSAGLDDIADPDPLIGDEFLFVDSLAWLVGKPGCGKSFVALDIAGHVGTGMPWQGHRVRKGAVLYLVAEGARGIKKRVRAWEEANRREMDGVWFLPVPVQAKHAGQWRALIEVAARLDPALIVIDTQARVTVGIEENSNTEMGEFVDQVERLRAETRACVVLVHHVGRNGETGRGATTLDGAVSTVIKVGKDGDRVGLECTKNKDGAEWDPVYLRAVPFGDSLVLAEWTGSPATGASAVKWLGEWWDVHGDEWVSASLVLKTVAVSESAFHRAKKSLVETGRLRRQGEGPAVRYQLPSPPS